jgi:hypothetical protein
MRILTMLLLALAFFLPAALAQTNDSIPCPTVTLSGPSDDKIADGQPADFTVLYYRWDQAEQDGVSFFWMLSGGGTILKGQGTSTISVDTQGLKGKKLTATVALDGLPKGCPAEKSITIAVGKPK